MKHEYEYVYKYTYGRESNGGMIDIVGGGSPILKFDDVIICV